MRAFEPCTEEDGLYIGTYSNFFTDPDQLKGVVIFCAFLASFLSLGKDPNCVPQQPRVPLFFTLNLFKPQLLSFCLQKSNGHVSACPNLPGHNQAIAPSRIYHSRVYVLAS